LDTLRDRPGREASETGHEWTSEHARGLATEHLSGLGMRWRHVAAVGEVAESLRASAGVADLVVAAAWLHDLGYGRVARTGFHPLDGATYLQEAGAPAALVGLVAHHTGAAFEAEERGLADELAVLPHPDPAELDVLTFIDLCTAPDGTPILPEARITEIGGRYDSDHPVHRAVVRSRSSLLASADRARSRLGLPDEWPVRTA